MTLPVKRSRVEEDAYTADCLMLLSKVGQSEKILARPAGRIFACKTCNKEFSSFQALGGHRASHNKPNKLSRVDGLSLKAAPPPAKPKSHECPICGLEFPIGQALGGHMRRHRAPLNGVKNIVSPTSTCSTRTNTSSSTVSDAEHEQEREPSQRVVKNPRFMIFGVDLSLVEPEKDVELELGLAGRESPALLGLLV